jgi:ATP-dependent helicase/nuclease subunit A
MRLLLGVSVLQGGDALMTTILNRGQRTVLDSTARRIVVSAGAGSGKTRVLAERFVATVLRRVAEGDAAAIRAVLLITFTDKAAGELAERVRRSFLEHDRADLARQVDTAWISTIHGFCARMVRRHALELGVDPAFSVLADPDVGIARTDAFEAAATSLLGDADLDAMIDHIGVAALRSSVLAAYDTMRSKGVTAQDVRPASGGDVGAALAVLEDDLATVLPRYRELPWTATIAGNLEAWDRLREQLALRHAGSSSAIAYGIEAEAGARALLESLADAKGRAQGGEEMRDLTRTVNAAIEGALQAVLDSEATRWSASWCRLLAGFDETHEQAKSARAALDFEDLQLLTRRLWRERPEAADRYRRQFVEVMVDEFQDTNQLQIEAIEPVAGAGLCVVGDVQQSIYRFRDADVALFQERQRGALTDDNSQACQLTVNYRSGAELLSALNGMFSLPWFFGDDYLHLEAGAAADRVRQADPGGKQKGGLPDAPAVEALVVDKSGCESGTWRDVEAQALARRLRSLVEMGLALPGEIVVLVRSTTTMPPYVSALKDAGFEVLASAAGGFYGTAEVADVRALLRVLANPLDSEGVLDLLAGGFGGLSDDALYLLATKREDRDLWAALGEVGEVGLDERDAERATLVRETIDGVRALMSRIRLADGILYAAEVLGPGGGCLARPGGWANVQKAARLAAEFERSTPADPASFLRHLDQRETFVRKEAVASLAAEGGDAVRVMTVHAAKGLEFPVVAVADLGHGQVNTNADVLLRDVDGTLVAAARGPEVGKPGERRASAWGEAAEAAKRLDMEEARRVFYVACTRAERMLLLSGSADLTKPRSGSTAIEWVLQAAEETPGITVTLVAPDEAKPAGVENLPGAPSSHAPMRVSDPCGASMVAPATGYVVRERPAQKPGLGWHPREIAPPPEISYTALTLFGACAYRFFAERMLKIGSIDVMDPDDPRTFGTMLHGALQLLALGEELDAERLAEIARACGSPETAVPRLAACVAAVRDSAAGRLLETGQPEVEFALAVAGGVVRGSMDLLVRDGARAIVLDYKTGATWDAEGSHYAAQAEVYALALLEAGCEEVSVRFVHVEAGCEEAVFAFVPHDAAPVRGRVEAVFARMSTGAFPPRAAFDPLVCGDCPVSGSLCPVVHPGAGKGRHPARMRSAGGA